MPNGCQVIISLKVTRTWWRATPKNRSLVLWNIITRKGENPSCNVFLFNHWPPTSKVEENLHGQKNNSITPKECFIKQVISISSSAFDSLLGQVPFYPHSSTSSCCPITDMTVTSSDPSLICFLTSFKL